VSTGTLDFRRWGFTPHNSLLMPAFSLPGPAGETRVTPFNGIRNVPLPRAHHIANLASPLSHSPKTGIDGSVRSPPPYTLGERLVAGLFHVFGTFLGHPLNLGPIPAASAKLLRFLSVRSGPGSPPLKVANASAGRYTPLWGMRRMGLGKIREISQGPATTVRTVTRAIRRWSEAQDYPRRRTGAGGIIRRRAKGLTLRERPPPPESQNQLMGMAASKPTLQKLLARDRALRMGKV